MFGLALRLLSSQVRSEIFWKTEDVPHLQETFFKRLHDLLITHSLFSCKINKALPNACCCQGILYREPECASFYDQLEPFPFKKTKWSLDCVILAGHKTLCTVKL